MTSAEHVVIIGAGQAGAQVCFSLRQGGFDGRITLIGDEAVPPYQRPPLSKAFMKGEMAEDRLYFKPSAWYEDNGVDLMLSIRAHGVDRAQKSVRIDHGGEVPFDKLVIATGSRPRPLPFDGADLDGVFDLRNIADVERIRPRMIAGRRLVILGGGYIGLEAAAVARQLGLEVTVIEMADRVLARVAGPTISSFFELVHRGEGVDIRTNSKVAGLTGTGTVAGVVLADGTTLPADMVLVGIGILPNIELAVDAGLPVDNGIVVDDDARTDDPSIFAVGDCANRPLAQYDRRGRLESVHNAIEQGKLAAAAILGQPRPRLDAPWFWSDQYDLKLQIAGLSTGYDQVIVRGRPEERKFAAYYFAGDRFLAVDAVNAPPAFMMAKQWLAAGQCPDRHRLADETIRLKEVVAT